VYGEAFTYGTFETRVRFATCSASEEVVNGIFTYFNDGSDQNGNGLADNSEIDIEFLCGTPNLLWLTTYTDFVDFVPGKLRKVSRKLDMRTGAFEDFTDWPPEVTNQGKIEGLSLPNFPSQEFYTLGIDWRADHVRYYIRLNGKEVDLFTIDDASRIPRRASQFLMNIWHANAHWTDGGAADYPAQNATMVVDSVSIWR
jgi:beta-glucanase (GH16 family)